MSQAVGGPTDPATESPAPRVHDPRAARRALLGAYVGTSLEWYDFFLFGTTASIVFAPLFFGGDNPALAVIQSFLLFGIGFLARPVGALLAGHFGDRIGRRSILMITIVAMGVSSALIGVLPTFETAGIVAPILLAVLRFVQGMAAGGEWGGATLMAVENAPENKRGFYGAVVQMGSPTGTILSSLVVAAVVAASGERFLEGAWRIPYLISIVLVVVGVWIRLRVDETDDYKDAQAARAAAPPEKEGLPALEIIRTVPGRLLLGVGTYLFGNAGFFVLTTFMISYATQQLGLPSTVILTAITWGAVAELVAIGIVGKISDRVSPSTMVVVGCVVAVVVAFPVFWLVDTRSTAWITLAMVLGLGLASIPYAPVGTMLTQLFPVKVRYSAIAMCANFAGVVAGFMPALAAWILGLTNGSSTGPAALLLVLGLISLLSAIGARRVIRRDEEQDVDQISGDLLNR